MALPKAHRLKRRGDFSSVYRAGVRRSTSRLTLIALRRKSLTDSPNSFAFLPSSSVLLTQIGISVSQKVSKRAVVRNRIRRQIQAILHQLLPQFSEGWQIVIVVRSAAIQCDYEQLLQELKQLLKNAEVINGR